MEEVLFYGRAVNNKLLVALNSIFTQQDSVTEGTNEAIDQLLYYLDTYSDEVILYISRNMVFDAHYDAGFHNKSKGCSQYGSHIFLSEDEPVPRWNGTIFDDIES